MHFHPVVSRIADPRFSMVIARYRSLFEVIASTMGNVNPSAETAPTMDHFWHRIETKDGCCLILSLNLTDGVSLWFSQPLPGGSVSKVQVLVTWSSGQWRIETLGVQNLAPNNPLRISIYSVGRSLIVDEPTALRTSFLMASEMRHQLNR